jgi:hypothetical protein
MLFFKKEKEKKEPSQIFQSRDLEETLGVSGQGD